MNMRPQISHSPRQIGEQNAHLLNCLSVAYSAALELSEKGFTVVDIEIGTRKRPVLWIARCRLCGTLHGVTHIRRQGNQGRERVMVASAAVRDAQVQWVEPDTDWRRTEQRGGSHGRF